MTEVWQRRKRYKKGYYADAYPQGNTLWHPYRFPGPRLERCVPQRECNGVSRCGRKSIGEVIAESAEMPDDLGIVCYLCRRQALLWGQRDGAAILPRKAA